MITQNIAFNNGSLKRLPFLFVVNFSPGVYYTRHLTRRLLHPAWIALVILAVSCTPPEQRVIEALGYSDTTIHIRAADCPGSLDNCTGADITIPVFKGGDSGVAQTINDSLVRWCTNMLGGSSINANEAGTSSSSITDAAKSITDAGKVFLDEYTAYKTENANETFGPMLMWYINVEASVLTIDSLICIRMDEDNFLGGAHPNASSSFITYDTRNRRFVKVDSLITDIETFTRAAEAEFRKTRELAPTADYAAEGYWFPEGFTLPDHIGLTKDSAILHYNSYDVAPYVMGPTEFAVKRPRLK